MKRTIATLGASAFAATLTLVGFAGPASASTPVVRGCVGSTFALNAQAVRPLGQAIQPFVKDPENRPGLGDGIQILQAGQVTQDVVPNTCNTSS